MTKKYDRFISGAGGGKGGHTPTEEKDTLVSTQKARFLDLICEGEIGGLVGGAKGIYFDDVPFQNDDDSYNFQNVTIIERVGTQGQDPIQIGTHQYAGAETPIFEGSTKIKKAYPITKHIADTNATSVKISLGAYRFTYQDVKKGDIKGTSCQYKFEIADYDGGQSPGPFMQYGGYQTLSGKSAGKYERSYLLTLHGAGPWDVKITRLTDDSTKSNIQNDIYLFSVTQIIDRKFAYPNSALIGMEIDATQFSSIPKRGYLMDLLKIKIPSNYNPVTREYSGSWDGTFDIAVCDNPAWVLYDIVTNDRYGLKRFIDTSTVLNKWQLYTIGRYCDVSVNNGKGGTEPRFTCNLFIQSQKEALKVVKDIASIFNAMTYWFAGGISIIQDAPSDPLYTFTNANVKNGNFNTSGSALGTRHTVALVAWNDPTNMYKQAVEYVEDDIGIQQYGYVPTDVTALGCTSQGQAHRLGRMILLTERLLTDTITFETALEGHAIYPGCVTNIGDAYDTGNRWGGRVVSSTVSQVTLDANVTLESGVSYELSCFIKPSSFYTVDDLPDDPVGYSSGDIVYVKNDNRYYILENGGFAFYEPIETRAISNSPGTTNVLTVSSSFSTAPAAESPWIMASDEYELKQYRVVSIKEQDDGIYQQVVAMEHDPDKYAAIEEGLVLEDPLPPVYEATTPILPCSDLVIEPTIVTTVNDQWYNLVFSWTPPADPRVGSFEVQHKYENGNWDTHFVKENFYEVQQASLGTHYFKVRCKSNVSDTSTSAWSDLAYVLDVNTSMPDVHGLELLDQGNGTEFSGRDAHFVWRKTSSTLWSEIGGEPLGGDSGAVDAFFKDYLVTIKDTSGAVIRQEPVYVENYIYSWSKNLEDANNAGLSLPRRSFIIEVVLRGRENQVSLNPAKLTVTNPAPDMGGSTPTVTPTPRGLKVNWENITPSDIDVQGYKLYCDTSSPPTIDDAHLVYTASTLETGTIIQNLTSGESYYVQIIPYDYFGVGIGTSIPTAESPLVIPAIDVDITVSGTVTITDSQSTPEATLIRLYDSITDEDPEVISYDPVGVDYWVQYSFGIAEYIDRINIWTHSSTSNAKVYIAYSNVDNPTFPDDWNFLACQFGNLPDENGRLYEFATQTEAHNNYWNLGSNANSHAAAFPEKIVAKHCRLFISTDSGSLYLNELQFVRQIVAEEIVIDNLAAITGNLGTIEAGVIQSDNWGQYTGGQWDIDNGTIMFGGYESPYFKIDPNGVYFELDGGSVNSSTLIQGGFIGTGLVNADSIVAGQITADLFTIPLEGDLNEALYYVKKVMSVGSNDFDYVLTVTDLENGVVDPPETIKLDATYHSDYGNSIRLPTQVKWDDSGAWWDFNYWDKIVELSGNLVLGPFDMGGSQTLSLAFSAKVYDPYSVNTDIIIEAQYSNDNGVNYGSNLPYLDDGIWETLSGSLVSSPTWRWIGGVKTFDHCKIKISLATEYMAYYPILYDPAIKGNIVQGFQSWANETIPVGGKHFDLVGFNDIPSVVCTSFSGMRVPHITSLTSLGFNLQLFNLTGDTDLGGTASIIAMGV